MTSVCYNWTDWSTRCVNPETVAVVTYTSMFTDGTSIIPCTYQHHLPYTLHYGYKHNSSIHSVSTHETVPVVTYTSMFTDRTSIIPCTYQHHLPYTLHYGYKHNNSIHCVCVNPWNSSCCYLHQHVYRQDVDNTPHIPTPSSLYPTLWI